MSQVINKLVRDQVINKILQQGGSVLIECAMQDETFLKELDRKLQEEVDEYKDDKTLEELVDILEVVEALATYRHGIDWVALVAAKQEKAATHGRFDDRIILKEMSL